MANQKVDNRIGMRAGLEYFKYIGDHRTTNVEMARRLGIERKAPYGWLNMETSPTAKTLQALALNGFDVVYILTGERTK